MNDSWKLAPWIETYENYSVMDEEISLSNLSWFDVKIELVETDVEKREHIEAVQQQVRLGILQSNGLPTGMNVPQHVIDAHKKRNAQNQAFRFPNKPNKPQLQAVIKKPDIFQVAQKKMSMIDELTRDRRKV